MDQPARGDGLLAGEELHTVHAVGVAVAEQRGFQPPSCRYAIRDRDGRVDADHSDLDLVLEPSGGAAVVGEDGGPLP